MTRLTYEYVKDYIEKFGYELLSKEYIDNQTKLLVRCPCGHEYEVRYASFQQGRRCKTCRDNKYRTSYEDVKNFIESIGYELLSDEYKNENKKIKVRCNKGHEYETRLSSLKEGCRCKKCITHEIAKNKKHSYEYIKNYIEDFGYELLSSEYDCDSEKIILKCPKGHIYNTATFASFRQGNRCPICRESRGEKEVKRTLDKLNVKYEQQYKFEDCKIKLCLPFDFYLFDYNILIEYDGQQHFEIVDFYGGLDKFIDTKIRDTIKNEYCRKNNIRLVRIPYWDFNEIEMILIKELNKYE